MGGVKNEGPFTPWQLRAENAPWSLVVPGRSRRRQLGRDRVGSKDRIRVRRLAGRRRARRDADDEAGLGGSLRQDDAGPRHVRRPGPGADVPWPCQKPPWGRLTAINAATGDVAWQIPLGITEQLPAGKQNTGRPALAGPIATAGGLLFVASTDDNRFRALETSTGKELWITHARSARQRQPDHLRVEQRQAVRRDRRD